jgi:hypothetical protein
VSSNADNRILDYNITSNTSAPFVKVFANLGALSGTGATFTAPQGLAYGPDNNLYVAAVNSSNQAVVLRLNGGTGAFLSTYVTFAAGTSIRDLVFDASGNLYAAVQGTTGGVTSVQKITNNGNGTGTASNFGDSGTYNPTAPTGLAVTATTLYVGHQAGSTSAGQVDRVLLTGTNASSSFITNIGQVHDITFGPDANSNGTSDIYGSIFTGNGVTTNDTVAVWEGSTGAFISTYATNLTSPTGLVFKSDNNLLVGHDAGGTNNDLIRRVPPGGGAAVDYSSGTQPKNPTFMTVQPNGVPEPGVLFLFGMASIFLGAYGLRCRHGRFGFGRARAA